MRFAHPILRYIEAMKIARDKWKHFYVGIAMGAVLQALGLWLLAGSPALTTAIVLTIVIVISYGFELFSKFTGLGHYDFMDAVASVIGGVLGMGLAALLIWLI
jgi:hypothetical protein